MDFLLSAIFFVAFIAYAFQLMRSVTRILKEIQMLKNDLQSSKAYLQQIAKAAEKVAKFTERYPEDQPTQVLKGD